jgi:hypothetical protein
MELTKGKETNWYIILPGKKKRGEDRVFNFLFSHCCSRMLEKRYIHAWSSFCPMIKSLQMIAALSLIFFSIKKYQKINK